MDDLEKPGIPEFEKIDANKLYEALETIAELEKKRDESEKRTRELAEVERPEVVGYRSAASRMVYEKDCGLQNPEPMMLVSQHDRIVAALSAQQSAQPEFCCKHSYKVAKQAAWGARDLTQCKCDHNEYCEHCWPDDFREGGKWHGGFETKQSAPEQGETERSALWAVHAQGPDELYAALSREDAEKHAAELNALPMPEGIAVGAVVVPSPWPAVQHWQYLAEQEQDHKNEIAGRLRQLERICEGLPQDAIDGGWTVQGIRGYAKRLEDQLKAALARVAELERGKVYVEARQCDECQHGGINDSATGVAACHECDWTGPEPEEDRCPGCQRENCMAAACPQCGARYVLVASEEIAAPVAQAQHSVPELLVRAEDFVSGKEVPQAWLDVQAERRRQITAEGWTPEHDDLYCAAELPRAAAAYILNGANDEAPAIWPFSAKWWKPRDARANYMRAGALILAEIERLDRAAGKEVGHE
ncbi:hypothetical protein [Pseudomonas phage TH15]|uniref:4Fe-4S ferredoxin-type domain-containing protein n=1 Tax=Pseudomonas phage TH15 TaxID=2801839 RepID=A0A7T7Z832_9CAUD|nr:hypothetical protein [Pseudomonas phage TH15]